jgi:hypothetical protein
MAPPPASHASRLALSRRGFLRLGAASAGFVALSRLTAVPAEALAAEPGAAGFFDERETGILAALVERLAGAEEAAGDPRARAVATIDALCRTLDPALTGLLPTALLLFEWWPALLELRFTRFTRLAPEDQDASLRGWMTSRFAFRRQAFYAIRNLAFLGWYSQPESWGAIGYAGPLLGARGVGARAGPGARGVGPRSAA